MIKHFFYVLNIKSLHFLPDPCPLEQKKLGFITFALWIVTSYVSLQNYFVVTFYQEKRFYFHGVSFLCALFRITYNVVFLFRFFENNASFAFVNEIGVGAGAGAQVRQQKLLRLHPITLAPATPQNTVACQQFPYTQGLLI